MTGGGAKAILSYREAIRSPCLDCKTSPCCTYLMLRKFELESLGDVDYVLYLSNFDGMFTSVGDDGVVRVYLYQPCGHLDVPSGLCKVHGTAEQPSICVHYNAHSCEYRHGMTIDVNPSQPLMDGRRARWYVEHVTFGEDRRVVSLPEWADVIDAFTAMPLERRPAAPAPPDPVLAEWRSIAISAKPESNGSYAARSYADAEVADPCQGCEAWCCHVLVFGRDLPQNASQLDFFKYCLGFPSVELGVTGESWTVLVRTTCRHLAGGRCSVYGSDERPLRCGYYDALKCSYRDHFGNPRPAEMVRVAPEHFPVLAASVVFDDSGRVRRLPSPDLLRDRIEEAMRASAG
ncbi:MAG: hypothetical protein ACRDWW_09850 [Acidimicrobiales bacterium]